MFGRLTDISLKNRIVVLIFAAIILLAGVYVTVEMPVDVFPDITAPSVTVMTEAHGMAAEEVEKFITLPIESVMSGVLGVRRVRSSSTAGFSVVWVEFDWGSKVLEARQMVNEKLSLVAGELPPQATTPVLGPVSSIMGEILFFGLESDRHGPMELRSMAEYGVRKRILSVPGVAQVIVAGGDIKQYQVIVDPQEMLVRHLSLERVQAALEQANRNAPGGFMVTGGASRVIRALGRARGVEDLEKIVVTVQEGVPVLLGQVARVLEGPQVRIGSASVNAREAVIIGVQKQPGINTLKLTEKIDDLIEEVKTTLPEGMRITPDVVRQAAFIETAVGNVLAALRDGAIVVIVVLILFLMNARATAICILAIPLSVLASVLAMKGFGFTFNTMTLGGLCIAIGSLVDNSIICMENIQRRLRENSQLPPERRQEFFAIVRAAAEEVRPSIVFATFIIIIAFIPLFFLGGIEGRLLRPLAYACIISIFASLLVALTFATVLCSYLLRQTGGDGTLKESVVARRLKAAYRVFLEGILRHYRAVLAAAAILFIAVLASTLLLGRSFLPPFKEGALTIRSITLPGSSLQETDDLGRMIEKLLLGIPGIEATARRTGRVEKDEHTTGISESEIDVKLNLKDYDMDALMARVREKLSLVPGTFIEVGQPISHRIDHVLSGTRASIAVKIFGPDVEKLRGYAARLEGLMKSVQGAVDVTKEPQVDVGQLLVKIRPESATAFGVNPGALAETIETMFAGRVMSRIIEGERSYDLVLRYPQELTSSPDSMASVMIDAPDGAKVRLDGLAALVPSMGPQAVNHENGQRRIIVSANVEGGDLLGVVNAIDGAIEKDPLIGRLPQGYHIQMGGQFESQREASRRLLIFGFVSVAAIFLLLVMALGSSRLALLVLMNLPLAVIGGIVSIHLSDGIASIISIVGFITLFGVTLRNGIMIITHIEHLILEEGLGVREAVVRGSVERLNPILMTALTTALALVPLIIAGNAPGNELQAPLARVVIGGLLSSTFLNMVIIPILYLRFGGPARAQARQAATVSGEAQGGRRRGM